MCFKDWLPTTYVAVTTVSEYECHTPSKEHYGNEVSLNEQNLSLKCCQSLDQRLYQRTRFRSFQRGIVGLCRSKDCKATSCQSWRSEKNPAGRPRPHSNQSARVRTRAKSNHSQSLMAGNFAALWPTDLKLLAFKDLNLLKKHTKNQMASSIWKVGFAFSKWPHFHRAY